MAYDISINTNEFILDLMKNTKQDELNYFYRGVFTKSITPLILALAEKNIDKSELSGKLKKRVFHIMVESLQNITRHQDAHSDSNEEAAFFAIQKKKANFFITTGNIIDKSNVANLRSKLEKVNSLDKDELATFYREILFNGQLSDKGGAGLGLIEMVRKSGNKLNFDFKEINDQFSYFYLHTNVSSNETLEDEYIPVTDESLKEVVHLHHFVNDKNIIFIFGGVYEQENLLILTSLLESQMAEKMSFKKKIICTMVEMIQNIIHHGEIENSEHNGNIGIFYISRNGNEFLLNTGNYMQNKKIPIFKEKLEHVNSLDDKELDDFYDHRLLDFEINSSKEAGLGIIDMRLKSQKKLVYDFIKINEEYSYFTLQTSIEKI